MSAIEKLEQKLKKYPHVSYAVEGNSLTIRPVTEDGFLIPLTQEPDEFTVSFGNWHGHFDTEEEALNYIAFGLSDSCRLREIRRGGKPYKWIVEYKDGGVWHTDYITGWPSFRFWHKKEEVVYQNRVLTAS